MFTQEELAKYIGRPLTDLEISNFDLYLDIATEKLKSLLCFDPTNETATQKYDSRKGFSTLYVQPFTNDSTPVVRIDGVARTDFTIKQNDSYNGEWFNIIEFDYPLNGEVVEVTADWGFYTLPADLAALLAGLFKQHSEGISADRSIKNKRIEDFSVTYNDVESFDEFVLANSGTIYKYAQCERGILHG